MKVLTLLGFILLTSRLFAAIPPPDEGMWLPMLIKDYNYEEMKRLGCKLTPEQIYSVNKASLKDAIVQLGGFCTAEVISDQGLILTNHHCGYDAIASQSAEGKNYLKDGFWAANQSEELNIPGLSVTFLVRMEDVTARMNAAREAAGDDGMLALSEEENELIAENSEDGRYTVTVKEMFDGNAFYLFVYEIYTDIRMVGAPPSSIGKFGGDTDNWMWPRHTGDFSMFRIYAGEGNQPAEYSESNKPFKPRHSLPVSMKGLNEGDFTMVMGYPGSTDRYLTSYEVNNLQKVEAPMLVDLFGERLRIMREVMDQSEAIEIENASMYASMSNSYKFYEGQLLGLNKFNLVEQKEIYEKSFQDWIEQNDSRKETYGNVLADLKKLFAEDPTLDADMSIVNIAGFAPEFVGYGIAVYRLQGAIKKGDEAAIASLTDVVRERGKEYFEADNRVMDKAIFQFTLDATKTKLSDARKLSIFSHALYTKKAKGSNENYVKMTFDKSFLLNEAGLEKFLKKPTLKAIDKDPAMIYVNSLIDMFRSKIQTAQGTKSSTQDALRNLYMAALREKETSKTFYPDANFTMRMTYGKIIPYNNWDGETYQTFTWADEILTKYKAGDHEFDVPEKLRTLISTKDFGPYANPDGKMPVCFIHDTDITGGNSGSPVIDAEGNIIGLAFDGNWESMTSSLFWQDEYVRTISVDIRYVLFIIDKFANATHLIKEMKLVY